MIKNYPLLIAGLLSLFFAGGHMVWGQQNIIGELQAQNVDPALVSLIWMGWNLQTSTTLLSGIALIIASMNLHREGVLPLAWFILTINGGRYIVLLMTAVPEMLSGAYNPTDFMMQSVGLFFYITVIFLGIRRAAVADKVSETATAAY
jgi:hypothetical protein